MDTDFQPRWRFIPSVDAPTYGLRKLKNRLKKYGNFEKKIHKKTKTSLWTRFYDLFLATNLPYWELREKPYNSGLVKSVVRLKLRYY
jgi:hypothetical protein